MLRNIPIWKTENPNRVQADKDGIENRNDSASKSAICIAFGNCWSVLTLEAAPTILWLVIDVELESLHDRIFHCVRNAGLLLCCIVCSCSL
jgi:hypothetical protein